MNKVFSCINRIIGIGFIVIASMIMCISLSNPQHNLIPKQIVFGVPAAACLFAIIYACLILLEKKVKFLRSDAVFIVLAVLLGIVLFVVGIVCRNSPVSFLDYEICYRSAFEYATSGTITDGMYFSQNPHNWKCVMVLSWIMKAGFSLGMKDPYYLLLIVNIIIIEGAFFSCRYLLDVFFPGKKVNGIMLLIGFGSCLPLYAYAQTFYTDSASFGFSIIGMALFHRAYKKGIKASSILGYFFAGLFIGMGVEMKITSIVCVIAMVMTVVLNGSPRGNFRKVLTSVLVSLIGLFLLAVSLEKLSLKNEWYRDKELYSQPVLSYIAMGLKSDGTFYGNREFRIALDDILYTEDKEVFVKEYLRENAGELWNPEHISAKIRANYASGNLGAEDFARYSYSSDNILNRMFNYNLDLYWYACKYNIIWQFQLYLIMVIGGVVAVLKGKDRSEPGMLFAELTIIGYFVFLFFWEANNRQLFNMLPVMIIGYVVSLNLIGDGIMKIRKVK